jgi:hypothetical protein
VPGAPGIPQGPGAPGFLDRAAQAQSEASGATADPLAAAKDHGQGAATSAVPGAAQVEATKSALEEAKEGTADAVKRAGRAVTPKKDGEGGES